MDLPFEEFSRWLAPQTQSGVVDYAFYKLINNYFTEEINAFGFALMRRMMSWVASVAFTLATLYFLVMGYRVATGQSREPMMGLVVNGMKVALVLGVATTMSFGSLDLYRMLTTGLDQEIHQAVSGNPGQTAAEAVDENLAYMQIAMNAIDAVRIVDGDDETREQKSRALLMAGFGTASVPMTVGALMLMYKFGIAFFVGLAPLFILCLMFDQTRDLFRKWLMSGIATFFSMAALSMMSAMALKLTGKVAVAFWVSKAIGGIRGLEAEGMSSLAIQQGGLGLILTVALVTVPPMVGMFFHGALGNFMQFSAFGGQGGGGQGASSSATSGMPGYTNGGGHSNRPSADPGSQRRESVGDMSGHGARYTLGESIDRSNGNEIKKR
ncbi:type IV secretion system protein [Lysobacter sp. BMK333-48F3]|uniref:type IV secretion system protein n=1 Tax=Lysobacter sp. BMK333-48F3 TaxID=2867962 RepID=UPI001C8BF981|nr:type IV secretion system protein [Lysobacter sp. BMK333-48F3]MBX9401728.1 type IV secretion system protein [Lysobacter sp. BMK333-48F3]